MARRMANQRGTVYVRDAAGFETAADLNVPFEGLEMLRRSRATNSDEMVMVSLKGGGATWGGKLGEESQWEDVRTVATKVTCISNI